MVVRSTVICRKLIFPRYVSTRIHTKSLAMYVKVILKYICKRKFKLIHFTNGWYDFVSLKLKTTIAQHVSKFIIINVKVRLEYDCLRTYVKNSTC